MMRKILILSEIAKINNAYNSYLLHLLYILIISKYLYYRMFCLNAHEVKRSVYLSKTDVYSNCDAVGTTDLRLANCFANTMSKAPSNSLYYRQSI